MHAGLLSYVTHALQLLLVKVHLPDELFNLEMLCSTMDR